MGSSFSARRPRVRSALAWCLVLVGVAVTQAAPPATAAVIGDLTTVSWSTSATDLRGTTGSRIYACPASGMPVTIRGTDTYTDTSSVCTAGVHAGLITLASGGVLTVTPTPGLASYTGSTRNGVTSLANGASPGSFVLGPASPPYGQIGWATTGAAFRGYVGPFTFVCPAGGVPAGVDGTDIYSDASSICTAAVHAGVITIAAGGPVTFSPAASPAYYTGTTRFGITTSSLGFATVGAFTIAGTTTQLGQIAWTRTASEFRNRTGPFSFICPAGGPATGVDGTDIYSDASSICTAAVHAGVITIAAGGPVTFSPAASPAYYTGTTRFGITTGSFAFASGGAFTIAGTTTQLGQIAWTRTAGEFRNRTGPFSFICPAGGPAVSGVDGTDIYTDDSSICTAAVHAGAITIAAGGTVTFSPAASPAYYTGTTRFGITTSSFAFASGGAFTIAGTTTQLGQIAWTRTASEFRGRPGPFSFECPSGGPPASVIGTDVYRDDSSICTAALHAGVITLLDGGPVTFTPAGGQPGHAASTRNGVTSLSSGASSGSFVFGNINLTTSGFDDRSDLIVVQGADSGRPASNLLTSIYSRSQGCATNNTVAPYDDCAPGQIGPGASAFANWDHDILVDANPLGSVAGRQQLDTPALVRNPGDLALSSSGSGPASNSNWAFATDKVAVVAVNAVVRSRTTSTLAVTVAQLQAIYESGDGVCGSTVTWAQLGDTGPNAADLVLPFGMNTAAGTYEVFQTFVGVNLDAADCLPSAYDPFENDVAALRAPRADAATAARYASGQGIWWIAGSTLSSYPIRSATLSPLTVEGQGFTSAAYAPTRTISYVTKDADAAFCTAAGAPIAGCAAASTTATYAIGATNIGGKPGAVREFVRWVCRLNRHLTDTSAQGVATAPSYVTTITGAIQKAGLSPTVSGANFGRCRGS